MAFPTAGALGRSPSSLAYHVPPHCGLSLGLPIGAGGLKQGKANLVALLGTMLK